VDEPKQPDPKNSTLTDKIKHLGAEQLVLLTGLFSFLFFLWVLAFLFLTLVSGRSARLPLPAVVVQAAATAGFVLPPTWTPGPTDIFVPTPLPGQVYDGSVPTRIYTPRATSLPGVVLPEFPMPIEVIDLARILEGESRFDLEAAYYVGWVAKNRRTHEAYGKTFRHVSSGFFGYKADRQPGIEFIKVAQRVIHAKQDPTAGCLYALSRTDITKLGVPPSRADVTKGEWFFFRTWPVTRIGGR